MTSRAILDALEAEIHVLYLVCHGLLDATGPTILLEDDRGEVDAVSGAAFVAGLADLARVPTIVVLCSCQSGGPEPGAVEDTAATLTALGPDVARAGAPVVIAMQGNVGMAAAADFLSCFFEALQQDGVPARAMAAARSRISETDDWFRPVLYSRLKRGSAWYAPRFGGRETAIFSRLSNRIREQHCTPVIGSGVAGEDGILPSRQQLARRWAERRQMPMSEVSRDDLASVAQYVSVDSGGSVWPPRDELSRLLRSRLRDLHGRDLPDLDWAQGKLPELVSSIGAWKRHGSGGADAYSRLARLPASVYVTTSWTRLMEDALEEAGKAPVIRFFDWYEGRQRVIGDDDVGPEFSTTAPLVYHLFGTFDEPKSLVLTEDDYFRWLRAWTKQVDKGPSIPHYVKPPLTDNALVFLGYVFDDWEFRMIFQAIKAFEGSRMSENNHVGVQIEPETLRVERDSAQEYLEAYFGPDNIDIYWSTCGKFLEELAEAGTSDE